MAKKRTPESAVLRSCLGWLALHRIMAWRTNNTGIFDPARKCYRTFHGLKGVSDILGVLDGGRILAVECKAGKNVASTDQESFLAAVRERGGVALCVWSLDDLRDGLRPILEGDSHATQ